ncbi:MAG: MerR family transcriptional regulator, partial [Planctomycetota bacterium]
MSTAKEKTSEILKGKRIAFVGKLGSMSRREAAQLVRRHGPDASVNLAVVGEDELPVPEADGLEEWFDEPARRAVEQGTLEVIPETQLWQRLGLVDSQQEIHRLYTPAMLAELLGVPVAVIRRWHRRGLIVPEREVRRLPYFDFQEVATARRLAELLAAGVSPRAIEKKLAALARYLPSVQRPLAQLSVIIRGKEILLRQGDGLIEPGGQLRFDFEAWESESPSEPRGLSPRERLEAGTGTTVPLPETGQAEPAATSPEHLCRLAEELEEDGQLATAA